MIEITSDYLFCIERRYGKRTCCGTLIDKISAFVAIDGPCLDVDACSEVVSSMGSACDLEYRKRMALWTYRSCALRLLGDPSRGRCASTQRKRIASMQIVAKWTDMFRTQEGKASKGHINLQYMHQRKG